MANNVFQLLEVRTGNLAITSIDTEHWGSEVVVSCLYRYPPEERPFKLRFQKVRNMQWITVKFDQTIDDAQVLTHDIGEGDYQRTARFATVLVEVVISYESVVVEKDW